jgi:hypothetical protein
MPELAGASAAQHAAAQRLARYVDEAYDAAAVRIRGAVVDGVPLAGEALACWRQYPECGAEAVRSALEEGLAALLRTEVAAAEERTLCGWRRDRAGVVLAEAGEGAGPAVGDAVGQWRRGLSRLSYDVCSRDDSVDPDDAAALLAVAVLGGRRGVAAGERLAELFGAQAALRVRDRAMDALDAAVDGLLRGERERRLGPVDVLDVTSRQQAELIAALSVLRKECA